MSYGCMSYEGPACAKATAGKAKQVRILAGFASYSIN